MCFHYTPAYDFSFTPGRTKRLRYLRLAQNRREPRIWKEESSSSPDTDIYALRPASQYRPDVRRVLYVGVTVNLIRRLDEHINSPAQEGAQFTALHPPVRVLQVGWFSSFEEASRAEEITADLLSSKFPDDFIAQPG